MVEQVFFLPLNTSLIPLASLYMKAKLCNRIGRSFRWALGEARTLQETPSWKLSDLTR